MYVLERGASVSRRWRVTDLESQKQRILQLWEWLCFFGCFYDFWPDPEFERYEQMSLWDHFWSILRLFDQTPYFRVKRFLQTVFGNVLVGSYFVQRNRNIAAAAPLSGLVPNSKSGIRAILKNGLQIFFENPKPICTGRASWIYFSRLVVLIPAILT